MSIEELDNIESKCILLDWIGEYKYFSSILNLYDGSRYPDGSLFVPATYQKNRRVAIFNFNIEMKKKLIL